MKKKALVTALMAGMTGAMGIVGVSNAVHVNPDGTGQVLIYPYYTTRNENDTLISVVNTTDEVKAIKVRFIEGENSREVLDFNLYMSPFDVWTASITEGANGPKFQTTDSSCLVPNITEFDFQTLLFNDGGRTSVDRAREGYVELIEMGNVVGPLATNAIHAGGTPASCAALSSAWVGGGVWAQNPDDQMAPPSGGLFGDGVVINVPGARAMGYDPVALDGFFVPTDNGDGTFTPRVSLHSNPGDLDPSLSDVFPAESTVVLAAGPGVFPVTDTWITAPASIFPINAVLNTNAVMNQYATEDNINGATEWVLTFPTKRPHVVGPAVAPFTSVFDGEACEEVILEFWDREEAQTPVGGPPVSPAPGSGNDELCYEVNVVTFSNSVSSQGAAGNEANDIASDVLSSRLFVDFGLETSPGFDSGWGSLQFNGNGAGGAIVHEFVADSGNTYVGLPTVGFAVRAADNASINALFGVSSDHKYTRVIQ